MTRALLLDEMFSPAIAKGLRRRGIDAYSIAERPELRALSDPEVLELATGERRIVVTFNIRDFQALDRLWSSTTRVHGGVVLATYRQLPNQAGAVGTLVRALGDLVSRPRPDLPQPGGACFL